MKGGSSSEDSLLPRSPREFLLTDAWVKPLTSRNRLEDIRERPEDTGKDQIGLCGLAPHFAVNMWLLENQRKDAPRIHRKGERMMDPSVLNQSRLETPNGLRTWIWTKWNIPASVEEVSLQHVA